MLARMWEKKEPSYTAGGNANQYNHYGKQYRGYSKKLKIELPYYPAILLLRIYLKECKSGYNKGISTPMFIAELFTISKLWKQPRCPSMMNGLRKCGTHTHGILFSHKEK
jgi:hypothetical protein